VWMQHMLAHLNDEGRMVVMLDRAAASRSSDPMEVQVRKSFVESDLIEAVVLCPWEISRPRWLVRTGILKTPQAVLFLVNKAKRNTGEILFVDTRPLVTDYLSGILRADDVRKEVINVLSCWTTVSPVARVVSRSDVVALGFTLALEVYCTGWG
jgi:type I restriction-modification system DNA methylase subunit